MSSTFLPDVSHAEHSGGWEPVVGLTVSLSENGEFECVLAFLKLENGSWGVRVGVRAWYMGVSGSRQPKSIKFTVALGTSECHNQGVTLGASISPCLIIIAGSGPQYC